MSATLNTNDEKGESYSSEQLRSIKTLEDLLDVDELLKLKQNFEESKDKLMTETQFKEVLEDMLKMKFKEDDFHILFLKMDEKRDGMVDWDELLSRLLIELQTKDRVISHKEIRRTVLNDSPKFIPSHHRHPISRICFYPELMQDKSASNDEGKYVTLSKDGTINFWSKEFSLEKSFSALKAEKNVSRKNVTDIICMPDILMIAASCNDGSIRFYDTMAHHFVLRVVLSNLREVINCMVYYMSSKPEDVSRIVTGDMGGNVLIFSFRKSGNLGEREDGTTGSRGPFSFRPGEDVKELFYDGIRKGEHPQLLVTEFLHIHPDGSWIEQISYCISLKSFISCSRSSLSSLVIQDERSSTQVSYRFHVTAGVSCFAVYEASYMLATGGVDCVIRLWNVFVPNKTIGVLSGHQSPICNLEFLQSALYLLSLAKDKSIKIWDVKEKLCIQTYSQLTSEIDTLSRLSAYFHHENNKLIIGYTKIVIIDYGDKEDEKKTDGKTHAEAVTKVLYNPLFKCLVSVGNDSVIMVWDIWTGKCISLITEAHTQMEHGTTVKVEITAAAFAPVSQQLLVTGARDGSLKVWNFISGECIRHMSITNNCEVTAVLWLKNQILAVGWDRCVTEFTDLDSGQANLERNGHGNQDSRWPTLKGCNRKSQNKSDFLGDYRGKCWETRHTEDLVCAAAYPPHMLVTASYNGELVLWKIETAQAYRRYHASNPTGRFALDFKKHEQVREDSASIMSFPSRVSVTTISSITTVSKKRRGIPDNIKRKIMSRKSTMESISSNNSFIKQMKKLRLSKSLRASKHLPHSIEEEEEPLAIHCLLFLNSRKCMPNVGNLLVSLEDGNIQVWCHILQNYNKTDDKDKAREEQDNKSTIPGQGTGYLGSFTAIHSAGEYIAAMATDEKNEFLFTGDTAGYLKVWLLENFFTDLQNNACAMYRKCFPFLLKDRFDGKAKKAVQKQLFPMLLSSLRAHLRAITCIEYISEAKIIASCSSDCSVRLWTLSGSYVGTLGQNHSWPLLEYGKVNEDIKTRIPPDIARVASFTTMKVLTGGKSEQRESISENSVAKEVILGEKDTIVEVNGRQLNTEQPLGKYFSLPKRSGKIFLPPKLDHTYGEFVPIYTHLICPDLKYEQKPNNLNISCLQTKD